MKHLKRGPIAPGLICETESVCRPWLPGSTLSLSQKHIWVSRRPMPLLKSSWKTNNCSVLYTALFNLFMLWVGFRVKLCFIFRFVFCYNGLGGLNIYTRKYFNPKFLVNFCFQKTYFENKIKNLDKFLYLILVSGKSTNLYIVKPVYLNHHSLFPWLSPDTIFD